MKQFFLSTLFLLSTCNAAEAPVTHTLFFTESGTSLEVERATCDQFITIKNVLDDADTDPTQPIKVEKCSQKTFIILLSNRTTTPEERSMFFYGIAPEQIQALIVAADYLNLKNDTDLITALAHYAIDCLSFKDFEQCITHIDRSVVQSVLKELQLNALLMQEPEKRNLAHSLHLGAAKVALLTDLGLFNFTLSIKDISEKETTKHLLTRIGPRLDLSDLFITDLTGLELIPEIGTLKRLMLCRNSIKKITATTFETAPQLEVISLLHNALETIEPHSFEKLSDLKFLTLNENKLTSIIAATFGNLPKLQTLLLHANSIKTIERDSFMHMPELRILGLTYNKITALAPTLFAHTINLKELYLHHNQLTVIAPETFTALARLETLGLNDNKIKTVDAFQFTKLSKLSFLSLYANKLTERQKKDIRKVKHAKTVTALD